LISHALHPTKTTQRLQDITSRYLKTIKPFQDDRLRREFASALEEENLLLKGPYIEITPPFIEAEPERAGKRREFSHPLQAVMP